MKSESLDFTATTTNPRKVRTLRSHILAILWGLPAGVGISAIVLRERLQLRGSDANVVVLSTKIGAHMSTDIKAALGELLEAERIEVCDVDGKRGYRCTPAGQPLNSGYVRSLSVSDPSLQYGKFDSTWGRE